MDYFPENLYQGIKKKPMSPYLIKIYLYQIMRGLMFMAFRDLAHRDMKPHNVLINSQTNKVVVCDFGSAKQLVHGNIFINLRGTKPCLHLLKVLSSSIVDFWSH
jgi:serine/threonine protein kinase